MHTVTVLFELCQGPQFLAAPVPVRFAWRDVITKKKKPSLKWILTEVVVPLQRIVAPPGRGTWSWVLATQLTKAAAMVTLDRD